MQYLSFLLRGSSAVCFSPSSPLVLNEKQECFCTDIELTYIVKLYVLHHYITEAE